MKILFTFLLLLISQCKYVNAQEQNLKNIILTDIQNQKELELSFPKGKLLLLWFISPECPLCQNYSLTFNNLHNKYKDQITVCGIIPGKSYSKEEILAFKTKFNIQYPIYLDSKKVLSEELKIKITPTAALFNKSGSSSYIGAIDNWAISLGKKRKETSEHYLENAIHELMLNKLVSVPYIEPVGCYINDL
ncbi:redoxin domain-containing protein [Sphingobacterium spiritivorum]|uniref:redoxin domain-containing protein n=1 Tax=Sphingobacterium spiritivorum TaxID=258 RepID=UPI003DA237AB